MPHGRTSETGGCNGVGESGVCRAGRWLVEGIVMSRAKLCAVGIACAVMVGVIATSSGPVARADGGSADPGPAVREAKSLSKIEVRSNQKASAATFDENELTDLATAAKSSGVSVSTLKSTHAGVTEFAGVVDALQASLPDEFVQAGLGTADDPTPWIVFTEKPDAAVLGQLAGLPVDVDVLYGAPASYSELEQTVSTLAGALGSQPGVLSAGAGVVGKGDAIEAYYALDGSAAGKAAATDKQGLEDAALVKVAAASADGKLPVKVDIVQRSRGSRTEATVEGGRDLNIADSNAAECTGGFTVSRGSEKGMVTAQHCANGLRYNGTLGVIQYVTAARDSKSGHTDLQYHRTLSGNSTNNQFRATGTASSDDRTVAAAVNPVSGQVACHWGRTSHYSCSYVDSTNYCETYPGFGTACNLDSTTADIGQGGDSGGPWFYGSDAIGVHSGAAVGYYSLFTRISAINDFLDATVLD